MSRSLPRCLIGFGALRSGTTLIRLMLDGHDALGCHGETDYFFDHCEERNGTLCILRDRLAENRIFRASGLDLPPRNMPLLDYLSDVLNRWSEGGMVTPVLMLHRNLGRALAALPDAWVVHMLRDPRDVAHSSIGMGWAGNTYFGVDHWMKTESEWDSQAVSLPDETFELRYETLVTEPEACLGALCAFAGRHYIPAMLSYPAHTTYDAPDATLAEQWRRKQTDEEVRLVETKLGKMLTDRGYTPSGLPPLVPDATQLRALTRANRAHRRQYQLRNFGWVLTYGEIAARKLRIEPLRRIFARRIAARVTKIIK